MTSVFSAEAGVRPGVALSAKPIAATIGITFAVLAWAVFAWAVPRGFDLQDEAAVLLWMSEPRVYTNTLTQFGFVYHPLYELLHGDVVLLRLAGSAILAACALLLAAAIPVPEARYPDHRLRTILSHLTVATGLLWQFDYWQTVPNYNSLNLCGLLLFSSGLLLWRRVEDQRHDSMVLIGCSALTAMGLCLVALAKPTSFVFALCAGAAWLVLVRPARSSSFGVLTLCVLTVFGIAAVYAIDGGVLGFWNRIASGLALLPRMQSPDVHGIGHSVLAPVLPGHVAKSVVISGCTALLFALDYAALRLCVDGGRRATAKAIGVAIAAAAALATVALFRAKFGLVAFAGYYTWHFALIALLGAICTVAVRKGPRPRGYGIEIAVLLAILPAVYSIGTNNPLFLHMAGAAVFWAAAAVVVCNAIGRVYLLAVTTALCGAVTAGMLLGVIAAPRLTVPPLWKAHLAAEIGPDHAKLLVDSDTFKYLQSLGAGAAKAGFQSGMGILDLSGTGPGFIFYIGASAPVTPWLVSGPEDTQLIARKVLSEIPRRVLEKSWVITGDDNNFALSSKTLSNAGLNFPASYYRVASAARPRYAWAQTLWKPVERAP